MCDTRSRTDQPGHPLSSAHTASGIFAHSARTSLRPTSIAVSAELIAIHPSHQIHTVCFNIHTVCMLDKSVRVDIAIGGRRMARPRLKLWPGLSFWRCRESNLPHARGVDGINTAQAWRSNAV